MTTTVGDATEAAPAPAPAAPPALAARARDVGASPVREILALTARPEVISFAGGLPAPELFDAQGIRAAYARVLAEQPRTALQYSTTDGDPALRAAVAGRLTRRGLATGAGDLLVTGGSQQGLALLATVLLEPGDVVLVENPTYLAALQCFGFAGARVVPVPTDEDGVLPDALEELVRRERPKLLYLIPDFQNPTGRTLPERRRRAVAEVAGRHGLWIAEDDPYGELRFEGGHLPWISSYAAAADRTVLLGSFSKMMAPGMRLGWLRAPAGLLRACVIAKQAADLHTSTVDQAAAARYLADNDLDAHLDRVRTAYRSRRDALLAGLPAALPAGSTWNRPDGGMFVWVRLPEDRDATALLPTAVAHDVAYVPGAPFYAADPDRAALRMSFTTHTPEEIAEGLRRLAAAFGGAR
ncbi:aminotransferase-like domain-containing protein [Actinacidiphila bryophytorum]|uniref:Aromatic-amino-acid aminotransferase 1 n=1 Tax=Actinacidiphila bryophytorum TaxID=1436133 RepID=A0A9W4H0P3_9ACTN|nr:PLP-dependent aminotransferase family protein [Actinacidiphila bryophytorum]MBM9439380.1 PLP-dependent aminotransferase family protein [Actinacidiphila bryophytorum]MBN6546651.1 PLP-dependent aminotransferase family protein [Actinacidiphila bryophytorum]CAG7638669.1 Aromatic-amino-acid aminotransferase 1 [Actinacidiphila bryophytorum]